MKRDFTWVQSLGILFDHHQLFIGAKNTPTWNDADDRLDLAFDGHPVFLADGEDANAVVIAVEGNFQIKARVVLITEEDSRVHNYGITGEDCFAHLDLSFKFKSLSGEVNDVLGQTYGRKYESRVKMGVAKTVLEKTVNNTFISSLEKTVLHIGEEKVIAGKLGILLEKKKEE
ncbi:PREDICTED: uncharacterized protein LOC109191743 [Ipomoea nil]|uniref:uncharacterized protein LOC109191743 n=1 Tax=Ipomoea nil TaxID=35883 RepID=UPI000900893E|nr:PREDICTED: uncharacterized protein LOC109191743 [Ipomoea nil]